MLADDIIAAETHPPPLTWYRQDRIAGLAAEIARAKRFVISADVITSMVVMQPPSGDASEALTGFCKLPFRRTWMEFAEFPPCLPNARCGVLVTVDDSMQRGFADICFGHGASAKDRRIAVLDVRKTFDWSRVPLPVPHDARFPNLRPTLEQIALVRAANIDGKMNEPWWKNTSDEVIVRDFQRAGVVPSPYVDTYDPARDDFQEQFEETIIVRANQDMARLHGFVLMLNCRNLVATTEQEITPQLARARQRSGKLPLRPFVSVNMKVTRALAARAGNGEAHTSPRLHIVRGHFKARKSGIFWWSPFARGVGDKPIRNPQIYQVKA